MARAAVYTPRREPKQNRSPDDCGGPPGYAHLLQALRNPTDKANEELLEWCGEWNPEDFDLESVNRSLSR